jgi:hypothetical protein
VARLNSGVTPDERAGLELGRCLLELWVPKMLWHARDVVAASRQGFDLVMPKAFPNPRETTVAPDELPAIRTAGLRYCFPVANPILFDEAHGIQRRWDDTDLAWILPIINRYKDDPRCLTPQRLGSGSQRRATGGRPTLSNGWRYQISVWP